MMIYGYESTYKLTFGKVTALYLNSKILSLSNFLTEFDSNLIITLVISKHHLNTFLIQFRSSHFDDIFLELKMIFLFTFKQNKINEN
jgi:hypothetical protein